MIRAAVYRGITPPLNAMLVAAQATGAASMLFASVRPVASSPLVRKHRCIAAHSAAWRVDGRQLTSRPLGYQVEVTLQRHVVETMLHQLTEDTLVVGLALPGHATLGATAAPCNTRVPPAFPPAGQTDANHC